MNVDRPNTWVSFIGQSEARAQLKLATDAAKRRSESLRHVLLSGPPGLGKTTIAKIVAGSLGTNCKETIATVLRTPLDVINMLVDLEEGDVLFIDEIHALPLAVQEYLYTAMEDFSINVISGPVTRQPVKIELNRFTLIGATTVEGQVSQPMLDRFGILCQLETYSVDDMEQIVKRAVDKMGYYADNDSISIIARRSRYTPRIALRQLQSVVDVCKGSKISVEETIKAYQIMKVGKHGLNSNDRKVVRVLADNGKPMGLGALSASTNIDKATIENVIEPHLMRCGFITRQPRGRLITDEGKRLNETVLS